MKHEAGPELPKGERLRSLLSLKPGLELEDLLAASLIGPVGDFLSRPGKRIRGRLVELGLRLSGSSVTEEQRRWSASCADALETLHAGSLVVDDIQDGSRERRGKPSLHLEYGVPLALNAGNWLYFWPLQKIRDLGLPVDIELRVYRHCHSALLRAHFGQALDVGTPIDRIPRERVAQVCLAAMELKSGALMALAVAMGAAIGRATDERLDALAEFGHRFGIALQMFDDLGNLRATGNSKRFEDLYLKRPSWIWATAASRCDQRQYGEFVRAVSHLPDESYLIPWLEIHGLLEKARAGARTHLNATLDRLFELDHSGDQRAALDEIRSMAELLTRAYE